MFTPSAQHLIQRHQIDQAGKADDDQILLGVKGVLIAVAPLFVVGLGEMVAFASCSNKGLLRRHLVINRSAEFMLY
ncbi:MAG: hypothetical protein PHG20_03000 [Geobacteraceae bacterium]|nr:hypothetical protein [Geobacteraceae bacterium]